MNEKICLWCKEVPLKKNSTKFCCKKHEKAYQYCQRFLDWYHSINSKTENRQIRKYLETINGHICSRCGITEWNNKPIVFDVDHIDGDSTNDCPNNVRLLCPNCHSLTSTYSFKNKKGRYTRMCKENNNE